MCRLHCLKKNVQSCHGENNKATRIRRQMKRGADMKKQLVKPVRPTKNMS